MQEATQLSEMYDRLELVLGSRPVTSRVVNRGYTAALRLVVELSNGKSVFVKAATDALTAIWLRTEHDIFLNHNMLFLV